ncbi:hypothetical protein KIN20_033184 [Parelaphostrongylus tenuis]|uniref:Uncharacterized protein n=1 Tax=Parelaphostrongylus tenuis TaxID=148309 RepID=A0AAD5WIN6_PARTN|nr:hypothetical protein KIN20_033184 [Parelaphostrongylus tenuis]
MVQVARVASSCHQPQQSVRSRDIIRTVVDFIHTTSPQISSENCRQLLKSKQHALWENERKKLFEQKPSPHLENINVRALEPRVFV